MKKIVGAVLAATLAAGVASADPKISFNYRMRADAFSYNTTKIDDKKTNTITGFEYAGYASDTDTLKFALSGDNCGATFQLSPAAAGSFKNSDGKKYTGFDALNTYTGWLKFGGLYVQAGYMKDGMANGNFRVKNDADAGNLEGVDFERFKPGTIFKTGAGVFIGDVAGFSATSGKFCMAEYRTDINEDNSIAASFGFVTVEKDTAETPFTNPNDDVDGDTTTKRKFTPGMIARVQFSNNKALDAEVIYKAKDVLTQAFGINVMPKINKTFKLMAGATFAFAKDNENKEKMALEGFGIDLRLRYADGPLSISLLNNFSAYTAKDAEGNDQNLALGGGIAGANQGWTGSKQDSAGKQGWANNKAANKVWWSGLAVRYKFNDTVTALLNGGILIPVGHADSDVYDKINPEWRITPAVQLYAAKNASLNIGVALSGTSWKNSDGKETSVFGVDIPMVLRVKF